MHRAEQERLTRTTEKKHTEMVDIDREDADVAISAESDIQNGEIRNFWFQVSRKIPISQFLVSKFLKPRKSQIPKSEDALTMDLAEQQNENDKLTTSQSLDSEFEEACGHLR